MREITQRKEPLPMFRNLMGSAEGQKQLLFMAEHRCIKHHVLYIQHPNCFIREYPASAPEENVACFDIETTGLDADWDILVCYCIKPMNRKKIVEHIIDPKDIRNCNILDRNITAQFIKDISHYDRVVAHYGSRFDIKFARTRALYWRLPYPPVDAIWQTDTWKISKDRLKMSRNRLGNIGAIIGSPVEKTRMTFLRKWQILTGHKDGMAYVIDHCRRDVLLLEDVFKALKPYTKLTKVSI